MRPANIVPQRLLYDRRTGGPTWQQLCTRPLRLFLRTRHSRLVEYLEIVLGYKEQ